MHLYISIIRRIKGELENLSRPKKAPRPKGLGAEPTGTSLCLPICELYVIKPGLVSHVVCPHVHLEGHVQLVHAGIAGVIGAIYVVLHSIIGQSNVSELGGSALELPDQVMPLVSGGSGATDSGVDPVAVSIAPYVPVAAGN